MADVPRHQGSPWSSWDAQRDSSPPGPLRTQPCLSADDKATGEWAEFGSGGAERPSPSMDELRPPHAKSLLYFLIFNTGVIINFLQNVPFGQSLLLSFHIKEEREGG